MSENPLDGAALDAAALDALLAGQGSANQNDSSALRKSILAALHQITIDPASPPAARASAARTLGEVIGLVGRHSRPHGEDGPPVQEASRAELEARLSAIRAELADLKA